MTTAQITAVILVAFCSFVALALWTGHLISSHRRQRERAALDRAVVEERDAGWWFEDRTEDECLECVLDAVDPPPSRLYIPPLDTARSMEPLGPLPPIGGVWS